VGQGKPNGTDRDRSSNRGERAVRAPDAFDPATWHGELRIGMCDSFELGFFEVLTARIRKLAPHARVVAAAAAAAAA
jgi:hypothetical protein